jgi:phage N-6-adenine-methyltransferase
VNQQTQDLMFSSLKQDWETPDELFERYKNRYGITLDVCATKENTKCENFISPEQDIFKTVWTCSAWINPPYNIPEHICKHGCKKKMCVKRGFHVDRYIPGQIDFVKRARYMSIEHGATTVCLLPARTDTDLFHSLIWDSANNKPYPGVTVEFLKGRLKFKGAKDAAPFPSMIVVFSPIIVLS